MLGGSFILSTLSVKWGYSSFLSPMFCLSIQTALEILWGKNGLWIQVGMLPSPVGLWYGLEPTGAAMLEIVINIWEVRCGRGWELNSSLAQVTSSLWSSASPLENGASNSLLHKWVRAMILVPFVKCDVLPRWDQSIAGLVTYFFFKYREEKCIPFEVMWISLRCQTSSFQSFTFFKLI